MQDHIGHNRRTALEIERETLRQTLSQTEAGLVQVKSRHARAQVELERQCWQDSAYAPTDRAHAAREALRMAHARRARLRDEIAEYDYELVDEGDYDDLVA